MSAARAGCESRSAGTMCRCHLPRREGELRPAGGSFRLELKEPFYVGLGVCAHNDKALETAVFSGCPVDFGAAAARTSAPGAEASPVQHARNDHRRLDRPAGCLAHARADRSAELVARPATCCSSTAGTHPSDPVGRRRAAAHRHGFATRCNNDHGISPDGTQLVISDQSQGDRRSRIYMLPIAGGTPQLVTRMPRPTGTAGRPMARPSFIAPSATANSISTRSRQRRRRKATDHREGAR